MPTPQRYSFDITDAVKGWKNGTYNKQKGIIFKAPASVENGSTLIAKTFASSDRGEYEPSFTIRYEVDDNVNLFYGNTSIDLEQGMSQQLYLIDNNGNNIPCTWSSSNTSVATVSSNGYVTTTYLGSATVTASFTFNGVAQTRTCIVYSRLPYGNFTIKNQSSGKYLTVRNGGVTDNTYVEQRSQISSSMSEAYRARQYWDIHYLSEGKYCIRAMNKPTQALKLNNNYVYSNNAGVVNALYAIGDDKLWTIEQDSDGFIFKCNGDSAKTLQVASSTEGSLVTATAGSSSLLCRWQIAKLATEPKGIYLYDKTNKEILASIKYNNSTASASASLTKYVAPEEYITLNNFNIEFVYYDRLDYSQSFTYTSQSPRIATIAGGGGVTGVSPGTATISAQKEIFDNNLTINFYVRTTDIKSGTYFIKNRNYGKFMQPEPINGPTSDYNETVKITGFTGSDYQKWTITHIGDGYYKITTGRDHKALTVLYADKYSNNATLYLTDYYGSNGQKWKITLTSHGSYKIKAKSSEGYTALDLVMDMQDNNGGDGDGLRVMQRWYIDNNSYMDEWLFNPALRTTLYGIPDYGHDHESALRLCETMLQNAGYINTDVVIGPVDADDCKYDLMFSNIFVSRSHGDRKFDPDTNALLTTYIILGSDQTSQYLYSHYYDGMPLYDNCITTLDDFSDVKLAIFAGCYTGVGGVGSKNLPTAIVEQGATTAIGFQVQINCPSSNDWTEDFFEYFIGGYSVEESVIYANSNAPASSGLHTAIICGDANLRIED